MHLAALDDCEAITTEAGCLARTDCIAIYRGEGCNCPDVTCECINTKAEFARCEAVTAPP